MRLRAAAGGALHLGGLGECVGERVDVGELSEVRADAVGERSELGDGCGEVELSECAFEPAGVLRGVEELLGLAAPFGLAALAVGLPVFVCHLAREVVRRSRAACARWPTVRA